MGTELDPTKDAINRGKHGLPLALGRLVLENAVGDVADPRVYQAEFGPEHRRIAFGGSPVGCSPASTRCEARFIA